MEEKIKKQQEEEKAQRERQIKEQQDQRFKEIESLIVNKQMTFEDIEKLNYQQINMVSSKFGEEEFNP